ncbi:type II CAAX endopeptidase family protein [Robiginitalea sp. M366]|uniref:CPBP family intramembrane glutamic endopeptidase n=1 Tax=Robiginitalea aestuariiviva TaxID=3036903 RepID=UPI00240E2FE6|nr:type II CAAX endopeptidase family protein [Robiginitalea aestuariiviva]MDG1571145.1 type II CAAX endopeptidase family protein [Robiginitalea aestuariiviva]
MKNLLRLLVMLTAVVLPHLWPLPFNTYSLVVLLMVWGFLKMDSDTFANQGFAFSRFRWRAIPFGLGAAIAIVAFMQLLFFPLLETFIDFPETRVELYDQLRGDTAFYILILIMAWIIGGLYEEIIFHGFIYTQMQKFFKGRYRQGISFLLTGILFGLYHLQLGPADALNAFVVGMAYHGLALYFNGNLWYAVFCHGFYNTIIVSLLYLGYI